MDAFRSLKAALALFCLFAVLAPASAQPPTELAPFQPVEGSLSAGDSQNWTFSAPDGAVLSFVAEPTSGDLDPVLTLLDGGGQTLISNDDYAYPDDRRAVLEAITVPRRGSYTLRVSAFGDTSGDYQLTLTTGFAQLELQETFDTPARWQALGEDTEMGVGSEQLALVQAGPQQRAVALSTAELPADLYAEVQVLEISGRGDWNTGLVVGAQGADDYALFQINDQGQWRFLQRADGEENVLRDWVAHPAINAGASSFKLAMLIRGGGFDFFYNDLFIGNVTASPLEADSQVGLSVETANVPDSETIGRFGELVITTSLEASAEAAQPPQQFIVGNASTMIQQLQRRGLIPAGGSLRLTVQESSAALNRPGVNEILLGGGQTFLNQAIGATVRWDAQSSGQTGCGLILRAQNITDYTLVYLDQTGGYGVSHRNGQSFESGVYGENPVLATSNTHHLMVIAAEDMLHYYIDGQLAGSAETASTEGAMGNAAVNFEPIPTTCQFTDTWLWAW